MFKKLLLSILCLSTLSSQTAPWINAKFLYPFIAAQTAAAAGYYFNDAYKRHKNFEFNCSKKNEISEWIQSSERLSFDVANKFHKIPIQYKKDQNGDYEIECQTLQNIRDRLESKVHEVQKFTDNKKIQLVIVPSLSEKHFKKLLEKEVEQNITEAQ